MDGSVFPKLSIDTHGAQIHKICLTRIRDISDGMAFHDNLKKLISVLMEAED